MSFSQSLLIQAADTMGLIWAYVDSQLIYRNVSERYCKWHHLHNEDVIGKSVFDVISQDTADHLQKYWDQALAGHAVDTETRLIRRGNSTISFVHATYVPDMKDDQVIGMYAFYQDHTNETKAIGTLSHLHEITADNDLSLDQKVNALLGLGTRVFNLPIAIVSQINAEQYIVRYALSPENAINPGDEFELGSTYCYHTLMSNGPTGFHHAGESSISDHPCYQTFGLESYIGTPIFVNKQRYGTLNFSSPEIHESAFTEYDYSLVRLLAQWIGNELSRYQSDREFKNQKALLEAMSRQARMGTWELDLINQQLYWSDMTREILEVASDFQPALEKTFEFYKEGKSRESVRKAIHHSIKTGQDWSLDVQVITAKGRCIWVNAMGQAEYENGKCVKLFGSFQDIHHRVNTQLELEKAKHEAEQALQVKGDFLANMSHEIRTPMNGVLGMLRSVLNSELSKEQYYQLKLAHKSADSLLLLINDILDFSKVDAGKLDLELSNFNLKNLMSEFKETMLQSAIERGLYFEVKLDGLSHEYLKGDEYRILQILNNLVGNALKFTSKGGVTLDVKTQATQECIQCVLSVKDTGIGIPKSKINTLFNAFTQADSSTTRQYGGTGLGLSIVKRLSELMNGDVQVISEVNKGSEFLVTLNLNYADTIEPPDQTSEQIDTILPFNHELVLLVEDNFINQEVAKDQLADLNLKVHVAENGLIALDMLKKSEYALVLMDCQMPEMDGYEATQAIRSGLAGESNRSAKIIAMTANAMKGDKEKCIEAGMDDYLSKPLTVAELQAMLSRYL